MTYVVGHCLLHQVKDPDGLVLTSDAVDANVHPHLAGLGESIDPPQLDAEFAFGLDVMLRGLQAPS